MHRGFTQRDPPTLPVFSNERIQLESQRAWDLIIDLAQQDVDLDKYHGLNNPGNKPTLKSPGLPTFRRPVRGSNYSSRISSDSKSHGSTASGMGWDDISSTKTYLSGPGTSITEDSSSDERDVLRWPRKEYVDAGFKSSRGLPKRSEFNIARYIPAYAETFPPSEEERKTSETTEREEARESAERWLDERRKRRGERSIGPETRTAMDDQGSLERAKWALERFEAAFGNDQ